MSAVRIAALQRERDRQSCDPRHYDIDQRGVPLFQVVDALRNKKRYQFYAEATSREKSTPFTISACPTAVRRTLNHLQARAFDNAMPKLGALTYCALEHGLQTLGGSEEHGQDEHPAVEAIRYANRAMNRTNWPDKEIRRVLADCSQAASFTEKLLPGGAHKRWNVRLPPDCERDLGGLAGDLGIEKQQAATLCLMWTLSNEELELQDQRDEYGKLCAEFLERCQLRADVILDLIEGRTLARRGKKKVKVMVGGKKKGKR